MLEVGSAEWLEFRASRVTATDAGKLWAGSSPAQVVAHKRNNSFKGNKYTDWGKEREPVIANLIHFMYGLTPTDEMFSHPLNDRFMASPDAVGTMLKQVGEYKTVMAKNAWTSVDDMPKQYYGQVQWQLYCTGAESALFAWEPHDNFVPGKVQEFVIHRDTSCIDDLVKLAEEVLILLDEPVSTVDPVLVELVDDYLGAKRIVEAARDSIEAYMVQNDLESGDAGLGSVSYRSTVGSARFDSSAFKAANPDLYKQFVKVSEPGKPVLRITERKIKNG